jgi:nucleoid DNA-binding protein
MAMNKSDLSDKIHDYLGGTKVQADGVMQLLIDEITRSLRKGEDVSIAGLGIFKVSHRKARKARNPRTGEEIQVPAMNVPKFKAAKALKEAVKEG